MCVPTRGFWDKSITAKCNINEQHFVFYSTLVHLLLDVAIFCVPFRELSKLQLGTMRKLGLAVTFASGTTYVCPENPHAALVYKIDMTVNNI